MCEDMQVGLQTVTQFVGLIPCHILVAPQGSGVGMEGVDRILDVIEARGERPGAEFFTRMLMVLSQSYFASLNLSVYCPNHTFLRAHAH